MLVLIEVMIDTVRYETTASGLSKGNRMDSTCVSFAIK